jgi:hypothetical protein
MKTAHFLKKDLTTSQDLSAGALSYTSAIARKFKLEEITIKASVPITETITITRDSANGVEYDVVLAAYSLVSAQSYVFRPTGECNFQAGDEIKIQCTNANLTGIVYATIKTSEL